MMQYGRIVRKIRTSLDMTLVEFAQKVGVSKSHIQRIENQFSNKGKEYLNIPVSTLKQICDRTGYSFRTFLEEAGYIEPVANVIERPVADISNIYFKTILSMYQALPTDNLKNLVDHDKDIIELQKKIIACIALYLEGAGVDSKQFITIKG